MSRMFGKRSSIRATYRRRVTEQAHLDGRPLFRPEIIGQWSEDKVGYFENEEALDIVLARWNAPKPWEYQITSITGIPPTAIPSGTMVFTGDSYRYYIAA